LGYWHYATRVDGIHRTTSPGRALDLGCGTGTNVVTLAKQGWEIHGVDFIPKVIRKARQKIEAEGVKADVRVDDVTQWNTVTGLFDLIYDIGCYHNLSLEGKRTYELNISQRLSPGSTFLLYGFLYNAEKKFGISQDDLVRLSFSLVLAERQDGQDKERPSAWFKFTKI
jgi:cyclopropane fatty-acyl-phospholipid synthase-like methyltransferase